MRLKVTIMWILSSIILAFPISTSYGELWDLIILADVENATILPGQAPIISGVIVDHASKPVELAKVHIRTGQESVFTVTDNEGRFKVILYDINRTPGTHVVNVLASTPEGKTGITMTEFQVKGEITSVSLLKEKINTAEAKRYLGSDEKDYVRDPIGHTLFKHYQKLYQEYLEEKNIAEDIEKERQFFEQQRKKSDELRTRAIEEFNPSYGLFAGYRYDDYIKKLNPEIRDTIIEQLNFTRNLFEDAQSIKQEILKNGGTDEEAKQEYMKRIAVTQEILNSFGSENIDIISQIENKTEAIMGDAIEEKLEKMEELDKTTDHKVLDLGTNSTGVQVELKGEVVTVNVNGTSIKFLINSTGIYQIDDKYQTHE